MARDRRRGPTEHFVRAYTQARNGRAQTDMEQALFMTLIDWRCEADMRPSYGEGSDCSDLMNVALARILGLASGDLTPDDVLEAIEPANPNGATDDRA